MRSKSRCGCCSQGKRRSWRSGSARCSRAHRSATLQLRRFPRDVPKMQDFDPPAFRKETIVNVKGVVKKPTNTNVPANGSAHQRKFVQQIDVIKQRVCEVLSSAWVPLPRP